MPDVTDVNGADFPEQVLKATVPVVVEFYTPTCQFCKRFEPILESAARKYGDSVRFCKVNAADNRELAIQYDIFGVPTTMIFAGGEIVDRVSGLIPESELEKRIDVMVH